MNRPAALTERKKDLLGSKSEGSQRENSMASVDYFDDGLSQQIWNGFIANG
jgi:hypothetical protein